MKITIAQRKPNGIASVLTSHGDRSHEWMLSPYERTSFQNPDNIFNNANAYLEKLDKEAQLQNGRVLFVVGNHELMNVDGDMNYVSYENLKEFPNAIETYKKAIEIAPDISHLKVDYLSSKSFACDWSDEDYKKAILGTGFEVIKVVSVDKIVTDPGEAVKILVAKGLLEVRRGNGTRVRQRASWNLLDDDVLAWHQGVEPETDFLRKLIDVRLMVEPNAAFWAAGAATNEQIKEISKSHNDMENAKSIQEFVVADAKFHRAVLRAANNELLTAMEGVIFSALLSSIKIVFFAPLDRASIPNAPVPAKRSRHSIPLISNWIQLNKTSLSLLEVGLKEFLKSKGIFLPFKYPPVILILFFI